MSSGRHGSWHGRPDDVYATLEAYGRAIVARLAAERPRTAAVEDAFAQARAYQAMLVGHADFARRPCRPEDEPALLRGHVELMLAVLRLMEGLSRDRRAERSGGGA